MNKLKSILTVMLFFVTLAVQAQNTTIPNVLNLKSAKQSGTIIEDGKLVGYYVFYFKEKTDKNINAYEVQLFDDNYNSVKTFEITRPKKTSLLEIVFNGKAFMMHFYDPKLGYEFITFDRKGKELGSSTVIEKDISQYELQRASANMANSTENVTFFPMGTEGFVRQTFNKNKKIGYEIVAYDNNANVIWTKASDENASKIEMAEITDVSENIISITVTKKTSLMTKKMDIFCLLLNSKSGDKIAELSMGTEDEGKKSLLKTFVEEGSDRILLIGEFYKPNDDILKDKSQGLFIEEITTEGKLIKSTEYLWKGDIDKFKQANLDEEDKKDADKPFYIYFHDVIRAANGNLYLVGEQFKKQVSASGTAMNVLVSAAGGSSNTSNFEIRLANMVVIEFDQAYKLTDFDLIPKKKTSINLPAGAGVWSTAFLGFYINSIGAFDYAFTSKDVKADKFSIVYIDANRKEDKESKNSDLMIGVIHIDQGERTQTRVPINTTAKYWWIQPAKPGFISVGEYFRKEKKIDLHLEPIKY